KACLRQAGSSGPVRGSGRAGRDHSGAHGSAAWRKGQTMKPQVLNYMLLCLVSLVILMMALAERGFWPWAGLPAVVGALALVLRWPMGTGLFLGTLCGILLVGNFPFVVVGDSPF